MIDKQWKQMLWGQLGGAIDMLENAIVACPDEVWRAGDPPRALWYVTYHTLFFLDLHTFGAVEGFAPPPPYTLDELDPAGVYPQEVYSREQLVDYLRVCRERCREAILELTEQSAAKRCDLWWVDESYGELFVRSLRHVQHHTAQLNWVLGERGLAPRWVGATQVPLG
jgi:DinB superfamily